MPCRKIAVALYIVASLVASNADAQGNDPTVYVFWAQSCPHSQRAMSFIRKFRTMEPKLAIRDYEVDGSPANAAAHERVLGRIGISGVSIVPVTVVGENVLVGFETDEISGSRIQDFVAQCRTSGCPDRMFDLMPETTPDLAMALAAPAKAHCSSVGRVGRVGEMRP